MEGMVVLELCSVLAGSSLPPCPALPLFFANSICVFYNIMMTTIAANNE
jgi:hypothetical protein